MLSSACFIFYISLWSYITADIIHDTTRSARTEATEIILKIVTGEVRNPFKKFLK